MSRTYRYVTPAPQGIDTVTCDRCKRVADVDDMEGQEFLILDTTGGFCSIFGDLTRIELDLCQHCIKELLGEYIKLSPST